MTLYASFVLISFRKIVQLKEVALSSLTAFHTRMGGCVMHNNSDRSSTKALINALVQDAKQVAPFQLPAVILHKTPTEEILDETVDKLLDMHMQVIEAALEACLKRTIDCSYFYNQVNDRLEPYVICIEEKDMARWDYVLPEIFFTPTIWVPTKAQLHEWHDWLTFCYNNGDEVPHMEYHAKTIDDWTFFRVKEVLREVYAHSERLHMGFAPLSFMVQKYGEEFRKKAIQKKCQEEDVLRETRLHLVACNAPDFLVDEYDRKLFRVKEVRRKLRHHHQR